ELLSFPPGPGGKPEPDTDFDQHEARILHYTYALDSCVRSSFGIGWEDFNGLNVDDGAVSNLAVHWKELQPKYVQNLSATDLYHIYQAVQRAAGEKGVNFGAKLTEIQDIIVAGSLTDARTDNAQTDVRCRLVQDTAS